MLLLRIVPKIQPLNAALSTSPETELDPHNDAVFLVQPGGRILFINSLARQWFGIQDEPNLERMARLVRPIETFLGLCAAPGQARLAIGSLLTQGTSYQIPYQNQNAILVSLRQPQVTDLVESQSEISNQTVSIFSELTQAITANLDLNATLKAVMESIEKLIPADFFEVSLWNPEQEHLVPYRLIGVPGIDRSLTQAQDRYHVGEGYSGYLIQNRKPLLVNNVDERRDIRPKLSRQEYPFRSYVGLPLLIGQELIGTLEMASLDREAFSHSDVEFLRLIAGQAAIAIHNALIYQEEQQRVTELSGLAQLAQATGSWQNSKNLFDQLLKGIAPLFQTTVLGFLIYDEAHRTLAGQSPFRGLPDHFIPLYRTTIEASSPAEEIFLKQEMIQSENAPTDDRLQTLGLAHLAQANGIHQTILAPLTSSGHPLGYLQLANPSKTQSFGDDTQRILSIVCAQIAPIIENANLLQQTRQRSQRDSALRRIASLSGSTANVDEILQFSLPEIAHLLGVKMGLIFLYHEEEGQLRVHQPSIYGIQKELLPADGLLAFDEKQFKETITASLQPFFSNQAQEDASLPPIYRPLIQQLSVDSIMLIPLTARDAGIGEILLASTQARGFSDSDVQMITTAAGQLANAVEQNRLYTQTDQSLHQQIDQLSALLRLGRNLNTSYDPQDVLQHIVQQAIAQTKADCGSILWQSTEGTVDFSTALQAGDPLNAPLRQLTQESMQKKSSLLIPDFQDSGFEAPHADIRSLAMVPIVKQQKAYGAIQVHATQKNHFDSVSIEFLQTLAHQAGIALFNAEKFDSQSQQILNLSSQLDLFDQLMPIEPQLDGNRPLSKILTEIGNVLQKSSNVLGVAFGLFNPQNQQVEFSSVSGLSESIQNNLTEQPVSWDSILPILEPFKESADLYFFPSTQRDRIPEEIQRAIAEEQPELGIYLLPLSRPNGEPLGLMIVFDPSQVEKPAPRMMENLNKFAHLVTLVILNDQILQQTKRQSLHQANAESKKSLQLLLKKDLQQSVHIQTLSRQAERIQAGLEIASTVNRQPDRNAVFQTLAAEMLARLGFESALVAEPSPGGPRLTHLLGKIPAGVRPETLLGQRNPVQQTLQDGQPLLENQKTESSQWLNCPLLKAFEAQAFASLPIPGENSSPQAAILVISPIAVPPFGQDEIQFLNLVGQQVSITLQNLALMEQTQQQLKEVNLLLDFTHRISSLDPQKIYATLLESAMKVARNAQAGFIAMWDSSEQALIARVANGFYDPKAIMRIRFGLKNSLPGQVFTNRQSQRIDEVDFAKAYRLSADELLLYQAATNGRVPISSMVTYFQGSDTPLGVIVLDNYTSGQAYSANDAALVSSLADQAGLTLENVNLFQASEQRAQNLKSLTVAAGTLASNLEPEALIQSLLDHLASIVPYDHSTLWIRRQDQFIIQAVRGFEDNENREGLAVNIDDSPILQDMLSSDEVISVPDVHQDDRFLAADENAYHSWMGVPLISKGNVHGVIMLEKQNPGFYEPDHLQLAAAFAGQAAVALENARLFTESVQHAQELNERTKRLALLNRFSTEVSKSLDSSYILNVASLELAQALPASAVSAIQFNQDGEPQLVTETPLTHEDLPMPLPNLPFFDEIQQRLSAFQIENIPQATEFAPLQEYFQEKSTQSLLILPLAVGNVLHGVLFVHADHLYRFSAAEVELGNTIANQTALSIQNARSYAETHRFTETLEQRVNERTAELAHEHHISQTLLQVISEISTSLDLDQVLDRTLGVLNDAIGAEQSSILLKRPEQDSLYYRASHGFQGAPPPGGRQTAIKSNQSLAGWVIENKQAVLIPDLHKDSRWITDANEASRHRRSALAVPLVMGSEALGALLLFHSQTDHFTLDHLDLVHAAANQVAIVINNAELYHLIRDQAERLGALMHTYQIEASQSKGILEAIADGVLVTDKNGIITLFNQSAEDILELKREALLNQSLEHFIGLFGKSARTWMNTIQQWSKNPASYQSGDTYAEQILMEDGRVVSVHLALINFRNEFLGTVSIFRDITHQIEVDRLKSEFVANVSHELRTPMTSIKGYVDILLMGAAGPLSEQQLQFLQVVKSNTERLNVLVQDLLDISRKETEQLVLSLQPLDIHRLTEQVIGEIRRLSEQENRPMEFSIEAPDNLPFVQGDPERIHQVLSNLVDNAFHYTPEGGHILVRIHPTNGQVQIDVQDNGIGIHPEDQEKIFERFYRGEHPLVLSTAGTGLGLPIVRYLIESHQGKIWVTSSGVPGEGSTFSITLPVHSAENDKQEK